MSANQQRSRVLIIEDEGELLELLCDFLRQELGPTVEQIDGAKDGVEAARLLAQFNYDVIISDYNFPKGGFPHLVKTMKEKNWTEPEVILISGGVDLSELKGLEGAAVRVPKPLHLVEFTKVVAESLARRKGFSQPRVYRRYKDAAIEIVGREGEAVRVLDISAGGFRIGMLSQDTPVDGQYLLKLLGKSGAQITTVVTGDVVWTRPDDDGDGYIHGVRIKSEDQQHLKDAVLSHAQIET